MSETLPVIYEARHSETAWSLTGQHTGLTDLPLTERGERNARQLGERLKGLSFVKVFTSPLQRGFRTCELAGFGAVAEVDRNLLEWDYGQYEGRRTAEIRAERPGWQLFRDGCPGGELDLKPISMLTKGGRAAQGHLERGGLRKFSIECNIAEYAADIWKVKPCPVPEEGCD
jgi:hypothetical protein